MVYMRPYEIKDFKKRDREIQIKNAIEENLQSKNAQIQELEEEI